MHIKWTTHGTAQVSVCLKIRQTHLKQEAYSCR